MVKCKKSFIIVSSNSADGCVKHALSWRKRRGKKGRESNEDGVMEKRR